MTEGAERKFRQAAWTYLGYGVVYWLVALYLQLTIFPIGGRMLVWFVVGAAIAVGVPWLLVRRRGGFERWILSRRDFTRLMAVLVAARTVAVVSIALHGPATMRMPSFGAGVPTTEAGAWLMALVAAATAVMLARAGWQREDSP